MKPQPTQEEILKYLLGSGRKKNKSTEIVDFFGGEHMVNVYHRLYKLEKCGFVRIDHAPRPFLVELGDRRAVRSYLRR